MIQINSKTVGKAPANLPRKGRAEAGFGMLEVLISLLILAIGLLGLASLQTTSLAQTTEIRNRSQAILLVDDLVERVRANRSNIEQYDDDAGAGEPEEGGAPEEGGEPAEGESPIGEPGGGDDNAGAAPVCDADFAINNNTDVATNDLAEWRNSLACLLPGGNGFVSVDDGVVTVRVVWGENGSLELDARP